MTRRTSRTRQPAPTSTRLDLALQGGGSHGAFTWGVLDRLLEDDSLPLDGVSGTSAGAMNAAVLATGLAEGGRDGARQALRDFWMDIASAGACFGSAGHAPPWPPLMQPWVAAATGFWQSFSPAQINPFDWNPLRDVLQRHVREASLRRSPVRLFVTATALRTGQPRVFRREDLTLEALLASACLPQLFSAVLIDGEPYWDGGYSGNPALWPLIYETDALDLMLVRINPLHHEAMPQTALEIQDRLNEITFNAALVSEMRAIHFVRKLVARRRVKSDEYKDLRLHMIGDDAHLDPLEAASKLRTDRPFLERLFGWGREAAHAWLLAHRGDIGLRPTVDIAAEFLDPRHPPRAA